MKIIINKNAMQMSQQGQINLVVGGISRLFYNKEVKCKEHQCVTVYL